MIDTSTTAMRQLKHRKIVRYGMGIVGMETILMGIWFYVKKPESDVALPILQMTLLLLGLNLMLGLLSYLLKKPFTALFFANAVLCPLIFFALWIMWFMYYAQYPA
ncbi:hypothetical protein N9954_03375 [Maribacter sp.]|nr:hypothetical protein [Maribacter sp.]